MKISIVTPTYNRACLVQKAIESSLAAFAGLPGGCEVIVVDDASVDDTIKSLGSWFAREVAKGTVRIVENRVNRGVTGSRNVGFELATGDWVIFLDSDDTLLPGVGNAVARVLEHNADRALVFFRCLDENGNPVGTPLDRDLLIDLNDFVENGTRGESLPVINRRIVASEPYVEELKGYEGFAYCRMISRHGPALVSHVVARRYDCRGADRRSKPRGMLHRMRVLAYGHRLLVQEFGGRMSWQMRNRYRVKAAIYQSIATVHSTFGGTQE